MSSVLIAGGGVGGLEAALALRALGAGALDVTLVSPTPTFVYRPWSVATPFGHGKAVEVDLHAVAEERGFELVQAAVSSIGDGRLGTSAGELEFDAAILSIGARQLPLVRGAFTFRGPQDAAALADALTPERLPDGSRVVFATSAGSVWALPAYELALLTAAEARKTERDIAVTLMTGELSPMQDFGPDVSRRVAEALERRGVELLSHTIPESFENGKLFVPMAGTVPADLAVALPALVGRRLDGLPADPLGFVDVDEYCRVRGLDNVYAIGDMTNRQLKQGGLTTQQADVAAASIAADAGLPVSPEPYVPVLRAMLLTGDEPLYLRFPAVPTTSPNGELGAPWWPPHKIAGVHLGPYLATHGELLVTPS
jgi:sulfide:quinone oxidoreductase